MISDINEQSDLAGLPADANDLTTSELGRLHDRWHELDDERSRLATEAQGLCDSWTARDLTATGRAVATLEELDRWVVITERLPKLNAVLAALAEYQERALDAGIEIPPRKGHEPDPTM